MAVGLPGTFVFLPMTLVGIIGGIAELSTEKFSEPFLLLAWAAAGLTGLCGFWVWTALGPHSKRKVRTAVAASVLVGTTNELHLREHIEMISRPPLSAPTMAQLQSILGCTNREALPSSS